MNRQQLITQIKTKRSFLCVGLDTNLEKIPKHLLDSVDPQFAFNKAIIDATAPHVMAFKPNLAFYERYGKAGWESLEKTAFYIKEHHPDIFLIADAKRGDIGNTSTMYAEAFFKRLPFDAITVAPYMGEDSVRPFMDFPGKWTIVLALTSNKGAFDFQMLPITERPRFLDHPPYLHEEVLQKSKAWGTTDNIMYVVGATQASYLKKIREHVPEHFLLIPGVGAQGGSLQEVAKYGITKDCCLIVNNSRAIIYASSDEDFAEAAKREAAKMHEEMENILIEAGIV